ncbi:secondary carrier transporter [Lithospermum erythrorhizon]|uniref:Secondary carrier transporter n=1 Tax=Lithospermum erythrorhizon TaxID=34254 RepID=A0AAV3S176_LITER
MDDFLKKFFPKVYIRKNEAKENNYCKFDDQKLQLFTSSLYLAAVVCSFIASKCCKRFGRKRTMQMASVFFFVGVILNAAAEDLAMLIIGRLCLGVGVGFGNQAVPLFISEIAPARYRGGLNVCFQLLITVGILIASVVNYFTSQIHPHGWRYSLGGAGLPAIFLFIGSFIIVETPTSSIERGKKDEGLSALRRIRGVDTVEKEYEELVRATEVSNRVQRPFRNLMKKNSRPQLICGTILQVFQQFTGINVIMFYAPVLFQTMGMKGGESLLSAVITNAINSACTFVAVFGVDKFGRKFLLIEAAVQMLVAETIIGGILLEHLKATNTIPKSYAYVVIFLICFFVAGFAWSWGPLGWLIPSEIFPLETRTAGFFFAVSMNMICTFIIGQVFLSMLCAMKAGTFFFFGAWVAVMGLFVVFLLPETKGIPIDEMNERVWKKHWYWKRYFDEDGRVKDIEMH